MTVQRTVLIWKTLCVTDATLGITLEPLHIHLHTAACVALLHFYATKILIPIKHGTAEI